MLLEAVYIDDDGELIIDYGAEAEPGQLSTRMGKRSGSFAAYKRAIRLATSNRDKLVLVGAYTTAKSDSELLMAIKAMGSREAEQFVARTAVFLARSVKKLLPSYPDVIVPASSSKPLAGTLAKELGARLRVPVVDEIPKVSDRKMYQTHYKKRPYVAKELFDPAPADLLRGHVLIVDDFSTTGSTMMGLGAKLLEMQSVDGSNPIHTVSGAVMALR